MKEKIFAFFEEKDIPFHMVDEDSLVTVNAYDRKVICEWWSQLVAEGVAVPGGETDTSLPKLFLLTPLSGDMCKYKLEIDF